MIERERDNKKKREALKTYDPNFNDYTFMAHYVAEIIKVRPNDILNHWGVSELLVTYGYFRNQKQLEAYRNVESFNANNKKKIPRVDRYAVYFYTKDEMTST